MTPTVHVALFDPEIPPNTGNIARLTVGFAVTLHIVGVPSFGLSEKALRRAGLDYWPHVELHQHASVWHLLRHPGVRRLVPITTRGRTPLSRMRFADGDVLAFGNESSGLPPEIHRDFGNDSVNIDQWGPVRSLNLATAAGIVLWEALRQLRTERPPGSTADE